jgi:hypothetical protein
MQMAVQKYMAGPAKVFLTVVIETLSLSRFYYAASSGLLVQLYVCPEKYHRGSLSR